MFSKSVERISATAARWWPRDGDDVIDLVQHYVIPAAYALLLPKMESDHATAMLLAIGLQESRFQYRKQLNGGPAHSFWMFEAAGVAGVLRHARTRAYVDPVLTTLCYEHLHDRIASCYNIIEHHDVLACCFARWLLWTFPLPLASDDQPELAWKMYVECWRPGTPRRETWDAYYQQAWERVIGKRPTEH